jgi:hypothetical protein
MSAKLKNLSHNDIVGVGRFGQTAEPAIEV